MKLIRLLFVPFALAVVGFIRLIAPWKLVRFGILWSNRLGHLIGNTECYLCERDAGIQPDAYDIWFHPAAISSKAIYLKYRELLHIWPEWFAALVVKVNSLFRGWEKHMVGSVQVDRDIHNLWEKHAPHIEFTAREERRGQRLLRSLGIPKDAKWICLIVRDSAYLKTTSPPNDFSYHDYRDSDVSDYIPTAVELVKRGYYVIRVGAIVGKPFHVRHHKIIDYATMKNRSDFGHLYLGAKCAFCIGTHCGFMAIPQAFRRPIGITNYVPLEYIPTWAKGLVIWKHHLKDGKKMSVKEIMQSGVRAAMFGPLFDQAGVNLEDNSPQEVFEVAMEMADRDQGQWFPENQSAFWDAFPRQIVNGAPLHGKIRIRIGSEFLKKYETKPEREAVIERMTKAEEIGVIAVGEEFRKLRAESGIQG